MFSRRNFLEQVSGLALIPAGAGYHANRTMAPEATPGLFDVRAYGAKGDGKADDTNAIASAISAAYAGGGGIVSAPTGVYLISKPLMVPPLVRLVGFGSRSTTIKATPSFPTDTPLIRIGNGKEYGFSCGVEYMQIECNHVYGSIGIYSTDLQENGGICNLVVNSYHRYGILLDDSGGAGISNWYAANLELGASSGAPNSTAIMIKSGSWKNRIENVSIVPHSDQKNVQSVGIHVVGGKLNAHGIHLEYHRDGVLFDENSQGSLSDVDGENVTNLVRLKTDRPVMVSCAFLWKGQSIVLNDTLKHDIRDTALSFYAQDGAGTPHCVTSSHAVSSSTGGLQIGNGAPITGHLSASKTWAPPSIGNGSVATTDISVSGCALGDTVLVGFSQPVPGGALLAGAVTAADTVSVTLLNQTGKKLALASGSLRADVWRH